MTPFPAGLRRRGARTRVQAARPLLALILLLSLASGCASPTSTPAVAPSLPTEATPTDAPISGTLRLWMLPLDRLDPFRSRNAPLLDAMSLVYEGLFALGEDDRPVPRLCSASLSADGGTSWSFLIRTDAAFHDGSALSPEDVAASGRLWLAQGSGALHDALSALQPVFTVVTADMLRIDLATPEPGLPWLLRFPVVPAARAQGKAAAASDPMPGTGPFRVAAYEKGAGVLLERTGPAPGRVERIRLVECRDYRDALLRFHSDGLDALPLDEETFRTYSLRKDVRIARCDGDRLVAAILSTAAGRRLTDPVRRAAVEEALDAVFGSDELQSSLSVFPSARGLSAGLAERIEGRGTEATPTAAPDPSATPSLTAVPTGPLFTSPLDIVAVKDTFEADVAAALAAALVRRGLPAAFRALTEAQMMDASTRGRYDVGIRPALAPLLPGAAALMPLVRKDAVPGAAPLVRSIGLLLGPRVRGVPDPASDAIYRGIEETWAWSGS